MKRPDIEMEHHDLIQWIFEHDFEYWSDIWRECNGPLHRTTEEELKAEVYDLIWDEVYYGTDYEYCLKYDEDEGEDYDQRH